MHRSPCPADSVHAQAAPGPLRTSIAASLALGLLALLVFLPLGCTKKDPQPSTYFEGSIGPILTTSCVRTNTGAACHVADAKGNAFGNLDTSTFDGVNHRRDLLLNHGPYGQPSLLIKNLPAFQVNVQAFDGTKVSVMADIKHVGGQVLDPTASAYLTLRRWIDDGATENNGGALPVTLARDPCASTVPPAFSGFDPTHDPSSDPGFSRYQNEVAPIVHDTCAAGNCHGTPTNVLTLSCGGDGTARDPETRWNFWAMSQYVTSPASDSQILVRPLAGGTYHEGGVIFPNVQDPGYQAFLRFATDRGAAQFKTVDPNVTFFSHRVQPILVKKGCMMAQCHSPAMFHDYRLRGGTGGSFSYFATMRNYAMSVSQLSLESDDVAASRLVRKNLLRPEVAGLPPPTPLGGPSGGDSGDLAEGGVPVADGGALSSVAALGILHRGGPLFEDFGKDEPSGAACDAAGYDYDNGKLDDIKAFCVLREWHKRERAARSLAPLSAIVYVKRPTAPASPDRAQDFDVFAGGAELHIAAATLTATSDVQLTGADTAYDLSQCGLTGSIDVRRPAVSWDGSKVAFAARMGASDPLALYEIDLKSQACTKHTANSLDMPSCSKPASGLLAHNFDPAYSPDGRLVFASTRGNLDLVAPNVDYCGPQRTPADTSKPNSNLYIFEPDPSGGGKSRIRQLTFLLNMERFPSFMSDGRLIFTTEKREPGLYQLALRRMNLDGGDYHPLYAQRGSIGAYEATYPIELADKNFAAIFSSPKGIHGAGAIVVFNRSIGIDFHSKTPADYPIDPKVIDPTSTSFPEDGTAGTPAFFLHSLKQPAQAGAVYTSPSPLPGGKILLSVGSGDPTTFAGAWDIAVFDPQDPTTPPLRLVSGGTEAVAVYARGNKGVFSSTPDEPNGHTQIASTGTGVDVLVLDMPVLASLLFQNTPTGRLVEPDLSGFDVFEEMPPDSAAPPSQFIANDGLAWTGSVYVRRRLIGHVPVQSDGSTHFSLPGGVPIVLRLGDTSESASLKLPRFQREEMEFAPGEIVNQSFVGSQDGRPNFFNGLCGQCHGAVSGRPLDVAVQPDILTQASMVAARGTAPLNLNLSPSQRDTTFVGPPSPQ